MDKKIVMLLKGGLGNQLFQYAFADYLGARGTPVAGFFPGYQHDTYQRRFLLDELLDGGIPMLEQLPADTVVVRSEDPDRILDFIAGSPHRHYLIDGYFQDVAYVGASSWLTRVRASETASVPAAIHVRRSDYGHHGLLPVNYYLAGLRALGNPPFRVYSDEPNFSHYVFNGVPGFVEVVQPDTRNPAAEFLQLAAHQAIVLANSTYSWMAAWIASQRHQARVAYPSEWSLISRPPGAGAGWRPIDTLLARP